MNRHIFVTLLLFLFAPSVWAADATDKNEIVYRTNLGRTADVKLLLKQGASPNQTDENGAPLIALASARHDAEGLTILKTLVDAGADINAKDKNGQTALFYAAKQGNKEIVTYLLEHGIDYYAIDNKNDIARNLAFSAGHKDIVAQLDKFVTDQTAKINAEYEKRNEEIAKRYKDIADQEQQLRDAATPKEVAPDNEEAPKENIAEKRATPQFQKDLQQLSFHACAFQYWVFCREQKQTTDLSRDELGIAIDSHRDGVRDAEKRVMDAYALDQEYVDTVVSNAKERSYNMLAAMPSNTYRFEHGVCKMADLNDRCGDIGDTWNQEPQPVAEQLKSHGGGIGGGGKTPKGKK